MVKFNRHPNSSFIVTIRKPIFTLAFCCFLHMPAQAGSVYTLFCNKPIVKDLSFSNWIQKWMASETKPYEMIVLAKGLRTGNTKMGSKNNIAPSQIYFDLTTSTFVSRNYLEPLYIPLSTFTGGTLTLPQCGGALVEKKLTMRVD